MCCLWIIQDQQGLPGIWVFWEYYYPTCDYSGIHSFVSRIVCWKQWMLMNRKCRCINIINWVKRKNKFSFFTCLPIHFPPSRQLWAQIEHWRKATPVRSVCDSVKFTWASKGGGCRFFSAGASPGELLPEASRQKLPPDVPRFPSALWVEQSYLRSFFKCLTFCVHSPLHSK